MQREAFVQVLCQRPCPCRVARHGKRKRGFALSALTRGSKLRGLCRCAPRFGRIAESRFALSSNRQKDRCIFVAVRSYGRVHGPPGQFALLAKMATIGLSVGCELKHHELDGLAYKPLLLFRHRRSIRPQEGKSVLTKMEYPINRFSPFRDRKTVGERKRGQ